MRIAGLSEAGPPAARCRTPPRSHQDGDRYPGPSCVLSAAFRCICPTLIWSTGIVLAGCSRRGAGQEGVACRAAGFSLSGTPAALHTCSRDMCITGAGRCRVQRSQEAGEGAAGVTAARCAPSAVAVLAALSCCQAPRRPCCLGVGRPASSGGLSPWRCCAGHPYAAPRLLMLSLLLFTRLYTQHMPARRYTTSSHPLLTQHSVRQLD